MTDPAIAASLLAIGCIGVIAAFSAIVLLALAPLTTFHDHES